MKSFLCLAPWVHSHIGPNGQRRLCCISQEPANSQLLSHREYWNGDFLKSVRRKMLNGEKISACTHCASNHYASGTYQSHFDQEFGSLRSELFANTEEDGTLHSQPRSFDLRTTHLCNLKCRMCGPEASTAWESEIRRHGGDLPSWQKELRAGVFDFQTRVAEPEFLAAVESKAVREIYWAGGEPLLMERHWTSMQRIVDLGYAQDVYVRYNTNLSVLEFKGRHLFRDLLRHFGRIQFAVSIDGAGKTAEYIRTGLKWPSWLKNIFEVKANANERFQVQLDLTLTLPGLIHLKEFMDLVVGLDLPLHTRLVDSASSEVLMSPLALPRKILNPLVDEQLQYLSRVAHNLDSLREVLTALKTRPTFEELFPHTHLEGRRRGKIHLQRLDQIRGGQDFAQIIGSHSGALKWWLAIPTETDRIPAHPT